MPNQEHLAKINAGDAAAWNQWIDDYYREMDEAAEDACAEDRDRLVDSMERGTQPDGLPNLAQKAESVNIYDPTLRHEPPQWPDLSGADLRGKDLSEFKLSNTNLRNTDLREVTLQGASLQAADLSGADLTDADLSYSDLSGSKLVNTILCGSKLVSVNFWEADLTGADFTNALFEGTLFAATDLSNANGLETSRANGPSTLGTDTISLSKGRIHEGFLRQCGLSDVDIECAKLANPDLGNEEIVSITYKIHELRATQSIQVSPLFVSYSHQDAAFVDKLENALNKLGIRDWRDTHEMVAGRLESQIDRAMRLNPTVLLVLSERSVESDWVEHEVRKARQLAKELKRDVLCPVYLDLAWQTCGWPERLREQIEEFHILDFSEWQDDDTFNAQFKRLLEGLSLFYK